VSRLPRDMFLANASRDIVSRAWNWDHLAMPGDIVLIAEDDDLLRAFLVEGLRKRGFVVVETADGQAALDAAEARDIDVFVLDRNLPGIDGMKLLRILRATGNQKPVVFLTAASGVSDRIRGLESGADDYVTKPFDLDELTARIRALARRPPVIASNDLRFGDVRLDLGRSKAYVGEIEIDLTAQDKALLAIFMRKPNQVFSREMLLDRLDSDGDVASTAIEHAISRLRRKLVAAGAGDPIETVRGVGYRLRSASDPA
jgi:two-component system, OmpR family, response regulator